MRIAWAWLQPRSHAWRRRTRLTQSPLRDCTLRHRYETIALERDPAGALSRLRVSRGDSPLTDAFAHALPQLTALTSPTKLPAKLARLVHQEPAPSSSDPDR